MTPTLATFGSRPLHALACFLICIAALSCGTKAKPSSICAQPIPGSKLSLYEVTFMGAFVTSSDPWGYVVSDSPSTIGVSDLDQLPRGRLVKVGSDGTIQLASFRSYDPSLGETVNRRVVHGIPVVETVFNTNGNGWGRGPDHFFQGIELIGDQIVFTGVTDEAGTPAEARRAVPAGGIVATDKDGILQSLTVHRVDPDSDSSPKGTRRRLSYEVYLPARGVTFKIEQLPSRGICKRTVL